MYFLYVQMFLLDNKMGEERVEGGVSLYYFLFLQGLKKIWIIVSNKVLKICACVIGNIYDGFLVYEYSTGHTSFYTFVVNM